MEIAAAAAATATTCTGGGGGGGGVAAAKVFSSSIHPCGKIASSSYHPLVLNHAIPIRSSSSSTSIKRSSTKLPSRRPSSPSPLRSNNSSRKKKKRKDQETHNKQVQEEEGKCVPSAEETSINVQTLYRNGDPLGQRQLGKCVVRWICQGMRAMASDFATAEMEGEFSELRQSLVSRTWCFRLHFDPCGAQVSYSKTRASLPDPA